MNRISCDDLECKLLTHAIKIIFIAMLRNFTEGFSTGNNKIEVNLKEENILVKTLLPYFDSVGISEFYFYRNVIGGGLLYIYIFPLTVA